LPFTVTNESTPPPPTPPPPGGGSVEVWWPIDQANVVGTQPFKAIVQNRALDTYSMFWQVDGDRLNDMYNSSEEYPHKEAMINVSDWTWKGRGPYSINFVAKDSSGNIIGQKSVQIMTN
jgi:hypothetical protein